MVESRFEVQTWTEGLLLSHVLAGAAAAYCYYFVTKLPLGLSRLVSCIPVFVLYAWLPLIYNRSTHLVGLCSLYCILTWLATFKLLLLCWGQGPGSEPLSFPRFAIVMIYPAHVTRMGKVVKRVQYDHSLSWWEQVSKSEVWYMLVVRSLLKLTVLALLLNVLSRYDALPGMIHHLLLSLQLFLFATVVLELLAAIASALFGVTIEPHFDNPFAASSLGEFWGRRWNLLVSNCLRETVYSPLLSLLGSSSDDTRAPESRLPQENRDRETVLGLRQRSRRASSSESSEVVNSEKDRQRRSRPFDLPKLVATMASFLVSGLCHELLVYYATLGVTWEMMSFFVVQGVAVSFEGLLKLYYPERRPPRVLATIWTLGFAFLSAHWLFWPPLDSTSEQMTWEMRKLLPF